MVSLLLKKPANCCFWGEGGVRGVEKGSRDAFQFWNAMTRETGQHKR